MSGEPFLDTNILVYAFEKDGVRAARSKDLLGDGGRISVQVLNEFANVCILKLRIDWAELGERLNVIDDLLHAPSALTHRTHQAALQIARTHRINIYDALVVSSAIEQGCPKILTEDLQHGALIEGVRIENPFRA